MVTTKAFTAILFCALLAPAYAFNWSTARGFNVTPHVTAAEITDLAAGGVNVIRVSYPDLPLCDLSLGANERKERYARLESVVRAAQDAKVAVIIDAHTYPGLSKYSTKPSDRFWTDVKAQQSAIRCLVAIASLPALRDGVTALDLLNEPVLPDENMLPAFYVWLRQLRSAISLVNNKSLLIIQPARWLRPSGRYAEHREAFERMSIPCDARTLLSVHMYVPHGFTHAGVEGRSVFARFPGNYDGAYWDNKALKRWLDSIVRAANGCPLVLGEFGASIYTGADGIEYLNGVIAAARARQVGWIYHAYRENPVWDAERTQWSLDNSMNRWNFIMEKIHE